MGLERNYDRFSGQNFMDCLFFINDVIEFTHTLNEFEFGCVNVLLSELGESDHDNVSSKFFSMVLRMHLDIPIRLSSWPFSQASRNAVNSLDDAIDAIIREFELDVPLDKLWESKCQQLKWDPKTKQFEDYYRKPWPYRPFVDRTIDEDSGAVTFELHLDSNGAHVAPLFDGVDCFTPVAMPVRIAVKKAALELLAIDIEVDSGSQGTVRTTDERFPSTEFTSPTREPILQTPLQREILAALDGKALRKQPLADLLCKGHGSRLYKKGGIGELMELGLVAKCHAGYYRPDAPPEGFLVSLHKST